MRIILYTFFHVGDFGLGTIISCVLNIATCMKRVPGTSRLISRIVRGLLRFGSASANRNALPPRRRFHSDLVIVNICILYWRIQGSNLCPVDYFSSLVQFFVFLRPLSQARVNTLSIENVVGIVTGIRTGRPRNRGLNPGKGKRCVL